jgi:hypothetical protein
LCAGRRDLPLRGNAAILIVGSKRRRFSLDHDKRKLVTSSALSIGQNRVHMAMRAEDERVEHQSESYRSDVAESGIGAGD